MADDKRFNDCLGCFSLDKGGRMGNVVSTGALSEITELAFFEGICKNPQVVLLIDINISI